MKLKASLALATISLSLFAQAAQAEVKILSSIRPIYYLVEGVNQGINQQELLVGGNISPHDYQPKPSDIQKIRDADIIFRIDEDFQPRFTKLFSANMDDAPLISLADIDNLKLLPNEAHLKAEHDEQEEEHEEDEEHHEEGEDHEEGEEEHHDEAEHGHSHSANEYDLHIWLSPRNAIKITDEVALQLSKLDPTNREKYQYNAKQQIAHLRQLNLNLQQQLNPYKNQYFFSYHDAYGYYTENFGLKHSLAITPTLNHQLSAHKMQEILDAAQQKSITCVMLEPQFSDKLAKTIVKDNHKAKINSWDPLGFDLELTANSYHILLKNMSNNLAKCLSKPNP
ncbi:MAG: zinc ABC transporter substrate-binding protein [Alphaproteobacteria bacterium]|nr:zinc ABC transporter substrate-binding protein [Alphaproteobacteria bacterium]